MNLKKYNVPATFSMGRERAREIATVCPYLIRIAKALARDVGETNSHAFYYYIGPAVRWRNANRRDDTPEELERITKQAETTHDPS